MKSGITFALLLGVVGSVAGLVFKALHWPGANGILMGSVFVAAIAFVFWMLHNAPRQPE